MKPRIESSPDKAISKFRERKPRRKPVHGVHVSRQRHGGTTFVTSTAPADVRTAVTSSQATVSKLRFIHNGVGDPIIWTPKEDPQHAVSAAEEGKASGEGDDCKQPNLLWFRTEDSTWCLEPSSADIACEQLGIWNRICRQMRILPLWSQGQVPKHLSEATPDHLKTGLDLAPDLFFPLDKAKLLSWNPMREMKRYLWIPKSSAILTTALMLGCLFEDVRLGRTNSAAFSALNTAACQALNAMIATKERTRLLGDLVAMIICKMALAANLRGNFAEWRTHIQGLQALMNNWCNWRDLDDTIACTSIYLADVEGALAAGQSPILSFQRRFPLIEPNLEDEKLRDLRKGLETLTLEAQLPSATGEALSSTCMFTHTLLHAKAVKATYHPHNMSEAFWGLNYELLSQPSPLFPDSNTQTLRTDQSVDVTARLCMASKTREFSESLDASVRIAALLFLRDPMAEVIFSRRGYPQLLSLLASHLLTLLGWVRVSRLLDDGLETQTPVPVEEDLIYPPYQHELHTMTPSRWQAVRSLLVWSSVLGHLYAVRMGMYGPCGVVFKDVVVEFCGGIVSNMKEEDLVLFQLLDMKYVSVGKWDIRRTLQHMMDQSF